MKTLEKEPPISTYFEKMITTKALSPEVIHGYIAKGEDLIKRIQENHPSISGPNAPPPTKEDMRAITWYMNARSTVDYLTRGVSMVMETGSIRFPDPNGRIIAYMEKCPLNENRISSHFNTLSRHHGQSVMGLLTRNPGQIGFEDYKCLLPCNGDKPGGCIVFAQLKDGTSFIKVEPAGLPTIVGPKSALRFARHFVNFGTRSTNSTLESTGVGQFRETLPKDLKTKFEALCSLVEDTKTIPPALKEAAKHEFGKHGLSSAKLGEFINELNIIVEHLRNKNPPPRRPNKSSYSTHSSILRKVLQK